MAQNIVQRVRKLFFREPRNVQENVEVRIPESMAYKQAIITAEISHVESHKRFP